MARQLSCHSAGFARRRHRSHHFPPQQRGRILAVPRLSPCVTACPQVHSERGSNAPESPTQLISIQVSSFYVQLVSRARLNVTLVSGNRLRGTRNRGHAVPPAYVPGDPESPWTCHNDNIQRPLASSLAQSAEHVHVHSPPSTRLNNSIKPLSMNGQDPHCWNSSTV